MEKQEVLHKLFKVSHSIKRMKEYNGHNKKHHSNAMIFRNLLENENINQSNMSKMLNITPQATSEMLKKLEADGMIKRVSGNQKNENLISLTEKGKNQAEEMHNRIVEDANRIFGNLTDEELESFYNILMKLNFDDDMKGRPPHKL